MLQYFEGTEEDLTADEDEFWRMCEERQAEQRAEEELMRMGRQKKAKKKSMSFGGCVKKDSQNNEPKRS